METHRFGPYTVNWISREEWDLVGRQASYLGAARFTALVPHHAVVPYVNGYRELCIDKMRFLQNLRPDLGRDIPYNWVVFGSENENECFVAEGRGLGYSGAHTYGYNSVVHAACFWGNSMTDYISNGVIEGFRFCGRLMLPYAVEPTIDHGSYPNQGTSCSGSNLRARLAEIQPPFNTPGIAPSPGKAPITEEDIDPMEFTLRMAKVPGGVVVDSFRWNQGKLNFPYPVSAFDTGIVRKDKTVVTVTLHGPNREPVTVGLIEGNGQQHDAVLVQWGQPVDFNIQHANGWCSVLVATDRYRDIKVQSRG